MRGYEGVLKVIRKVKRIRMFRRVVGMVGEWECRGLTDIYHLR